MEVSRTHKLAIASIDTDYILLTLLTQWHICLHICCMTRALWSRCGNVIMWLYGLQSKKTDLKHKGCNDY